MSKIKNGGLDQYYAEPFEQQQFGTAGVAGVNSKPPIQQTPSTTQMPGRLPVPQLRPRSTQGRGNAFSI